MKTSALLRVSFLAASVVFAGRGNAHADTILFDNLSNGNVGYRVITPTSWDAQRFNSDAVNPFLTSVTLNLSSSGGGGSFFLSLYSDAANQPGTTLATLFTGTDPGGGNILFGGLSQALAPQHELLASPRRESWRDVEPRVGSRGHRCRHGQRLPDDCGVQWERGWKLARDERQSVSHAGYGRAVRARAEQRRADATRRRVLLVGVRADASPCAQNRISPDASFFHRDTAMKTSRSALPHRWRWLYLIWVIFALAVSLPAGHLVAAIVRWSGTGGDDLWSNGGNWQSGAVPMDDDDVVFDQSATAQAELNFSLRLGSFTFASNAAYTPIHVGAGTASTLTLAGVGIINDPGNGSGGPIRQDFFADAGSGAVGGTILFTNTASVTGNHNVNLTASGATVAGAGGGNIIFQDHSSTAAFANFTALVAGGASIAGAGGGTVILRGDALAQGNTQIVVRDGTALGAAGGQMTIQDRARVEANMTNLAGDGGLGGRIDFRDHATLVNGLLENFGAFSTQVGEEAVTRFSGNSAFNGVAANYAGNGAGFAAGRIEFRDHAVFGIASGDPTFGQVEQILNYGSSIGGASGGKTVFYDDSTVVGTTLTLRNDVDGEASAAGSQGGTTEFRDRSHAGQVVISNSGATTGAAGTFGGRTFFYDNTSADSATIENFGGSGTGSPGGNTLFANNSTAGNATLIAHGGTNGGLGGQILFQDSASGGAARVIADVGGVFDLSALTTTGTTVGSLEGGGNFFLGGKTLTVGGNGLSTVVNGVISDGGQAGGSGGALTKVGAGALTLSGANTYTGATTVNAGALYVNGSIGGSGVTVAGGAKLGGSGTINAPTVVINGTGTLSPGSATAPGTLTVNGDVTLNAGTNLNFRLGAPGVIGGPKNDLLAVSGNLTLAGSLNVADSGGFAIGSYRLINYGGALTNNGLAIGATPAGFSASDLFVQTSVTGQVNLIVGTSNVVFWDGAQTAPNSVVDGGTGSWNNGTTNWTNATGEFNRAWPAKFAIFSGTAGTVTVTENVSTTGMQFLTDGYLVGADAGKTITLVGAAIFRVDPALNATISAPLTGNGSLTKLDAGTLTLLGASSYTGGTTIQAGQLNAGTTGALGSGAVTVKSGGTLQWFNTASASGLTITNATDPAVAGGGNTAFGQNSTAGASTITNQANNGNATTFGASLRFRDNADAGTAVIVNEATTLLGGNPGLSSGSTLFTDNSSAAGAMITNRGGAINVVGSGFNATTQFFSTSRGGAATIFNEGGTVAGSLGGYTVFQGTSTAENATITNRGGAVAGASGGSTTFYEQTTAGGSTILNARAAASGASGGRTVFSNSTNAGTSVITNQGAFSGLAGSGGSTQFIAAASAGAATFFNQASTGAGVFGGITFFSNTAVAGTAGFDNQGAAVANGYEGDVQFYNNSSADHAAITNRGMTVSGGVQGGIAYFYDSAKAGNATIQNEGSAYTGASGFAGGSAQFFAGSSADHAAITNAGNSAQGGVTRFKDYSSAGSAAITNGGAQGAINSHGNTYFFDYSSAATATITNVGGGVSNGFGGTVTFNGVDAINPTTAASASITNLGAATTGAFGGSVHFDANATAGSSAIVNRGATVAGAPPGASGFALNYAAGNTLFSTNTRSGDATITNEAGAVTNAYGGNTNFANNSTAERATITNQGAALPATAPGLTRFFDSATAGTATITNGSGTAAGSDGGLTQFYASATAGSGVFHNRGATVDGAGSGQTQFFGTSSAGAATLYAEAGVGNAAGGAIVFFENSSGGTARAILNGTGNASGGLDISQINSASLSIGSIEGTGIVSLGNRTLVVGTNNSATTFAGLIRDGGFNPATGGSLTVLGGGRLTLTGANTYTGATNIGNGFILNSGKLVVANPSGSATGSGPVFVNYGGTLSGSGSVAGPVTLRAGGIIAPGDPTTLTLQNSLTWDGGGTIRLVLGANTSGSDQLVIGGALIRGADGEFQFDLVYDGAVVGETYDLIHFGSLDGFSASDFTFIGSAIAGNFALVNGALDFTVTSIVPELGVGWSVILGSVLLVWSLWKRPRLENKN